MSRQGKGYSYTAAYLNIWLPFVYQGKLLVISQLPEKIPSSYPNSEALASDGLPWPGSSCRPTMVQLAAWLVPCW